MSKILIFSEIICNCLPLNLLWTFVSSDLHSNHTSKATKGFVAGISSLSELHSDSEVENQKLSICYIHPFSSLTDTLNIFITADWF